jgi:hypothetical protein
MTGAHARRHRRRIMWPLSGGAIAGRQQEDTA